MSLDKKNNNINLKKPYLLVDSSYVSFHRFFSTLIWYNNMYPDQEICDDYEWVENEIFMKHFDESYMKNLLKFKNMYNVPFENMIIVRDCPRETIWRMNIFKEYKATRKNTCNYKNKKFSVGNIFKHIYNNLYPKLEEQFKFKIIKVENAEADDVIAVLANKIREVDKNRLVVIISNDNDYLQLVNEKTLIWSLQNKLLNTKVEISAEEILKKKILKGDESDNIPSIVGHMSDKELMELIRDPIKLEKWLNILPERKNMFLENQRLIDFNFIPVDIKNAVLRECNDILPLVEVENKKPEIKEEIEEIVVQPIIKIKTKTIISDSKNIQNINQNQNIPPKIRNIPKTFISNFANYRNYGNPHHHKQVAMSNAFFQNRYKNRSINFATEDYYLYGGL